MIQRIQTLFLFLGAILLVLFPFIPILEIIDNQDIYILKAIGLKHITYNGDLINCEVYPYIFIAIFSFISSGLIFSNIFLYKNRKLQIKVCKIISLLIFLILFIVCFFIYKIKQNIGYLRLEDFHLGIVLIIFSIFSNFMASYYIKEDEKLVRSADRLR